MNSLISAELSATCSALGYFDVKTNKYYADSNTLETAKDLIRYLRRDDETHDIRRRLGETKVLQTDLLPLMKSYWEENDLFDVILRLVVNLTTPALILWGEEIPADKTMRNYYLQIEDHLQFYKEAFADEGVWAVLSTRLSKILEIDYAERGEENSLIIERILILIRNVLYVPADTMEKRPDNDASVHDQVLWALHQSGMLDIILYITSSSHEQAYYMHILEILSFLLREQKPSELAHAALQRSQTEKIRDEAELLAIKHREMTDKQHKTKKYAGARHSRFGGTFVVKAVKSISDNELIYHKPLNKLDALNFDVDKKAPKTPRNRTPIVSNTSERRSAFTIRLFLKEFCVEFLNGAYNALMYSAKDNLARARTQSHDESYYLWAMRFFMEFNRSYKFEVKLVSETMSVQTFHYVQQLSENYFDLMQTDKKKLRLWSRRLHLALLAYRELFYTLCVMDKSPDESVKDSAKVIKSNIFYVPEYREFVLALLVNYNELKMSDVYLKDLMETQHIFLKMFESFCAGGSMLVRKKKDRRARKKKGVSSTKSSQASKTPANEVLNLDSKWDEASQQLSVVLEGGGEFISDVVPFDAASDVPIDDQKTDAMIMVQRKLRNLEFESAIGLLRAAREVWPENDNFGSHNMSPEEEFLSLREIFYADFGENVVSQPTELQSDPVDNEPYDDEDDEEDDNENRYAEEDLDFTEFLKRLPHPKIVRACGLALKNFETNSVNTNHCIIKLLHRIAFDAKMSIMVFQLSIFRTFQTIFSMKDLPQYKELVKFATYIVRQFFKVAETNRKIFVEALFWKSKREVFEIENNYEGVNGNSKAPIWTEEQEDELRRLFMEHQNNNVEQDAIDWIVENLIDNTRSRRGVIKKLKEMCLIVGNYHQKKSSTSRAQTWASSEESQLEELYKEFKDSPDPLGCIMPRLEISRPKNRIIDKMLLMGLIKDKAELRKKRVKNNNRKSGKSKMPISDNDSISEHSDSDGSDTVIRSGTSAKSPKVKATQRRPTKNTSKPTGASKAKTKNKKISAPAGREQLVKHLLQNMNAGRQDALDWLKESLSDAIEDFEDGNNEGIPLVPIMDYSQEAMENSEFQEMLKAFGICEPFDEQEVYWRIPGHLTVDILSSFCSLIQEALENTLTGSSETNDSGNGPENSIMNISNHAEDVELETNEETENEDLPRGSNTNDAVAEDEEERSKAVAKKSRFRATIDSDSDDENKAEESNSKRLRSLSDSDTETPVKKRNRIIDSDED